MGYDPKMPANEQQLVARSDPLTQFLALPAAAYAEAKIQWEGSRQKRLHLGILNRVRVLQTAGAATSFDFEVRTIEAGTGLAVIYAVTGEKVEHDVIGRTPYFATSVAIQDGFIWVAIQPIGGDGTYSVELYAEPRRITE